MLPRDTGGLTMRVLILSLFVTTLGVLAQAADPAPATAVGASALRATPAAGPVDGPPVARSAAILTADRLARVHWTMSEINRTGAACGGGFQSQYPVGPRIGMAYKWGDWNTVEEFLDKIARGYGAGTGGGADTYDRFPRECVTGTSCAGLVSRAWALEHKYTLDYPDPRIRYKLGEITHGVPGYDVARHVAGDLRKGDALLSSTHVMLFAYETRDHGIMVIDARTPGAALRSVTWDWLAQYGYEAIRYNNILEDPEPAGTRARPIPIGPGTGSLEVRRVTGTWIYAGNTRDVVGMEFDRYSIAPGINQQGPEVVYTFTLESSATVTLHITDFVDEGIDNDVHLLASLRVDEARMAVECLARGDVEIRRALDAGTYFVVVDSGQDLPGEFTLQVDLE
jgi:hypothetical protein